MTVSVAEAKHKVPAAAKRLGLADKSLWAWIADGRIGVYRIGRSVRIGESEIQRILEEGYTPARGTESK